MATYKGHLLGGMITFLIIAWLLALTTVSPVTLLGLAVITLLGACFPDIDTTSAGRYLFYFFFGIGIAYAWLTHHPYMMVAIGILALLPIVAHHRGLLHHPLFLLFLCGSGEGIIYWIKPLYAVNAAQYFFFFFMGVLSHLILDFGIVQTCKRFFLHR